MSEKPKPLQTVTPANAQFLAGMANRLLRELEHDVRLSPAEMFMVFAHCTTVTFNRLSSERSRLLEEMGKTYDFHKEHRSPNLIEVVERAPKVKL